MGAFLDAALLFTGVEVTFISGVVGGIKHSDARPSPSQSVEVTDRQNGKEEVASILAQSAPTPTNCTRAA